MLTGVSVYKSIELLNGKFCSKPEKYPFDLGMYARYEKDLLKKIAIVQWLQAPSHLPRAKGALCIFHRKCLHGLNNL